MQEHIAQFEVALDVSDRAKFYDYATGVWVLPTPAAGGSRDEALVGARGGALVGETGAMAGGWRDEQFGAHGAEHADQGDSTRCMQMKKMDRIINDVSTHQEIIAENTNVDPSDSSVINILPRRVLPVYRPGEVIEGRIILKVVDTLKADSLSINLLGECVVSVKLHNKFGPYDEMQRDTYINKTVSLWRKADAGGSTDPSEDCASLLASGARGDGVLTKGTHTYPFAFTLPKGIAQSLPNLCQHKANNCYVTYRLKAKLTTGKALTKREVVTHKGIWVEKPFDIGSNPEYHLPVVTEETIDTGFVLKSAKISIKGTIPRRAFARGENIPLRLEIDNQTAVKIDKVSAFIHLAGHYRLSSALRREIDVPGKKTTTLDVAPGQTTTLGWLLSWDFAGNNNVDENLMPAGTLDGWKLIDVKYSISVKVKRKGMHRNIQFQIPLVIGNCKM